MTAVENHPTVGGSRREVRRLARRTALLDTAMAIVAREGIPGLTMQGVADELGCSVGTVYAHFASKGVLMADLQVEAIRRLIASFEQVRARSRQRCEDEEVGPVDRAAVEIGLFAEFFIAAWQVFPEESHLLFSVLAERGEVVPASELGRVVGATMVLMAMGAEAVLLATTAGALSDDGQVMDRVITGATALIGVLLTSHLVHLDSDVFDYGRLARIAWRALMLGWGMSEETYESAAAHLHSLAAEGPIAPKPSGSVA